MDISINRFLIALGAASAMQMAVPAFAEECEFVDTINNRAGALTMTGYGFVQGVSGETRIRGNGCQGTINIRAANPAKTSNIGDGVAKRAIDIYSPNVPPRTFSTRFRVDAPSIIAPNSNLGLVFRDIEFTHPFAGDGIEPTAHLAFSLSSWSAGRAWEISSRLKYQIGAQYYDILLGRMDLPNTVPQIFEVLVEYSQTYDPMRSQWKPQIKLTYYRFNSLMTPTVYQTVPYTMPIGMEPVTQTHGLIGQEALPIGTTFTVRNCMLERC